MLLVLVLATAFTAWLVVQLLNYYSSPKSCHPIIYWSLFQAWLIPLSLAFLLPIDVSSARYDLCQRETPGQCEQSLLFVEGSWLHSIWLGSFWVTFIATWVWLPFLQGFVQTGEFEFGRRCWASIRFNLLFYGASLIGLGLLVTWLVLGTTIRTAEGVGAWLMALSNAFGLLLLLIFMGHGLVDVPRSLWRAANYRLALQRLEYRAPRLRDRVVEAEAELADVQAEVQSLAERSLHRVDLEPYILELEAACPSSTNGSRQVVSNEANARMRLPLNMDHLVDLNYRLKEAMATKNRRQSEWRKLVCEAFDLQDALSNRLYSHDHRWTSSLERSLQLPAWQSVFKWWWRVRIYPWCLRGMAMMAGLLSVMVIWSELVLPLSTNHRLSLIGMVVEQGRFSNLTVELFCLVLLLYMACCTYNSFMKMRVSNVYRLVPHQHTDEKSLLFFASLLSRLAFPLGYNYLMLMEDGSGTSVGGRSLPTQFNLVMGTINLVPLLGKYFNLYLPVGLTMVSALVALRLHNRALANLSMSPEYRFEDVSGSHEHLLEGRELINNARRLEERRGPTYTSHSGSSYSSVSNDFNSSEHV